MIPRIGTALARTLTGRPLLSVLCIALSMPAFALQDLSDDAMSAADGQAGLTISIPQSGANTFSMGYQDPNGVAAYTDPLGASSAAVTGAGDLDVDQLGIQLAGTAVMTFDVGATAAAATTLDANLKVPSATINLTGTASAALGMQELQDMCTATAGNMAQCSGATDNPFLVMPTANAAFSVTATGINLNLEFGNGPDGHLGILTDTAPLAFVLGNNTGTYAVGLAFADAANVKTATTAVGGVGVEKITLTGVDFGETAGTNYTELDVCAGASSGGTAICNSLGSVGGLNKAGVALTFVGTAMSGITLDLTNMTAGNIGTGNATYVGATSTLNYGSINIAGLSMAGASLLVSGH